MNSIVTSFNTPPPLAETPGWITPGQVEQALGEVDGHIVGRNGNLQLGTHFQPIFSLSHQRMVGVEALLRATGANQQTLTPLEVFCNANSLAESVTLDRLCRAVHLRNFVRRPIDSVWLFLNVNPQVLAEGRRYGSFLQTQLERTGLPPHQLVVEILEAALTDQHRLLEAVQYYRDLGCLIAIDDFGAGHSNFDRICRLRPDIVKLDRSIVEQAARDRRIRAIVPGMVSMLHEAGSLVVMEGIETELEAMVAMDADADFVQGYYFAQPAPDIAETLERSPALSQLFNGFKRVAALERAGYRSEIAPYINGLGYSSVLLKAGQPFAIAADSFLGLPQAERCFLLDGEGMQIGNNLNAPQLPLAANPRFTPLSNAEGANWSRRDYFRRAIAHPEKVHVTRPYLSAASATPCVTVSIAFKIEGATRVLCGDVSWNERHSTSDRTLDMTR